MNSPFDNVHPPWLRYRKHGVSLAFMYTIRFNEVLGHKNNLTMALYHALICIHGKRPKTDPALAPLKICCAL
jgi:hypothetical protein